MDKENRKGIRYHFAHLDTDKADEVLVQADVHLKEMSVYWTTVIVPAVQGLMRNAKKLVSARHHAPMSKR